MKWQPQKPNTKPIFILPKNTNIKSNFNIERSQNADKIPRKYQEIWDRKTKYRFGFGIFLVYQIFGYRLTSLYQLHIQCLPYNGVPAVSRPGICRECSLFDNDSGLGALRLQMLFDADVGNDCRNVLELGRQSSTSASAAPRIPTNNRQLQKEDITQFTP